MRSNWLGYAGFLTLVFVFLFYINNSSIILMVSSLIVYLVLVLVNSRSNLDVLYLWVLSNLFFIVLAFSFGNGQISYLDDDSFSLYYKKSILLETVFWAAFSLTHSHIGKNRSVEEKSRNPKIIKIPFAYTLWISILLLVIEIIISSNRYFSTYENDSGIGTIAFELGCFLLAFGIFQRGSVVYRNEQLILECLAVGLAAYVVSGSGKRLPFAFIVIAYLFRLINRKGLVLGAALYFCILIAGFVFGIFRDFMDFGRLEFGSLISGLESTNQGASLHAAAVYLRIIEEGLVSTVDRGISFIGNFLGSLFMPMSWLPEQVQINVVAMRYYAVQGNGGLPGVYSYFFLGWVGPILFGSGLGAICSARGKFMSMFSFIVILTSPRWTLYNVGPVIRLVSMFLLLVMILQIVYIKSERIDKIKSA
jgi:hypothetical protein